MKPEYDLLVLGGGAAGLTIASGAAQLGAKVALVSNALLGGDCLMFGCIPSKALIKSARIAHTIQNANKYGLYAENPKFDFLEIQKRIQNVIGLAAEHDDPKRFRDMGVDVIFGKADFWDEKTIYVKLSPEMEKFQQKEFLTRGSEFQISGRKIAIATGSRPFIPPIQGLRESGFVTNKEIFSLKEQPKTLAILGGGAIGCEMAQAFVRIGTKVFLLIRGERILPREEEKTSEILMEVFREEGIAIHTKSTVQQIHKTKEKKVITFLQGEDSKEIEVDEILVATGRIPNMDFLKLERAGIEYDKRGITTDARLRTSKKHIYAAGDINGKSLFTHTAGYEGGIVVANAIIGISRKADYDNIPRTTFTDPEIAVCGLSETEAKKRGISYRVWTHSFEKQDRALTESETRGFIKILTTGKRAKIIGGEIVGSHAGEVIHELILARNAGLTLGHIASSVHIYPTLSEIVKTASGKFFAEKLFSPKTRKILRFLFQYRGKQ
ncbi:mercuric reductase [Candidatus Peregrinibacteria bacterium]|nr:MAG: mercuric reductase [Candidatus Peregrinibacteria bacterium]